MQNQESWVICRVSNSGSEERLLWVGSFSLAWQFVARKRREDPAHHYRLRHPEPGESIRELKTVSDLVRA